MSPRIEREEAAAGPRIRTELPGPKARALIARDAAVVSPSYPRDYPFVMDHGRGAQVWDVDGNRFLDFAAGIAVCSTGHSHPEVVSVVQHAAAKFLHISSDYWHEGQVALGEKIAALAPMGEPVLSFFCQSGTEAVEAALKLARYVTGRPRFIGFLGGFHGRTMGSLAFTSSKYTQQQGFFPAMAGVTHVPYPNPYRPLFAGADQGTAVLDYIENMLFASNVPAREVAAILVEPIQGEGGYIVPPDGFLAGLRALCDRHGILLIADEVQSGIGRSGRMFACEHWGVAPDIMTLAKGLGSGLPIGMTVAKRSIMEKWKRGAHGNTYGGNPVCCAAALKTVELVERGYLANAAKVGAYFLGRLRELQSRHAVIGEVRGKGLMVGMELVDPATRAPAGALCDSATEITHSGDYDYQPDWSSDGRHVAFARYDGAAVELWQIDLDSGRETQLTHGGAVNVEPRYAPDGRRIAYVSTSGSGHFNLFVADVRDDRLDNVRQLVASRKSAIARYYYSAWDHAISPAWTPDGRQIVFVGNREIAYGSGGLWKVHVDPPGEPVLILNEETSWRARPQVAPDGRRVLFASHHGRQWHQLWMTTLDGALPLPVTFGDFDRTDARISPDGTRMAYISNEHGKTSLWVQDMVGGAAVQVVPKDLHYKRPMAQLTIAVREAPNSAAPNSQPSVLLSRPSARAPVPARISVIGSDGRAYAPSDRWMHADDGFDRKLQKFENHYFHCPGTCTLSVPRGRTKIAVLRGLDFAIDEHTIEVGPKPAIADIALRSIALPPRFGTWTSADLHVHMNYGGHYRHTVESLADQMRAEHLDVIHELVVNKEERVPDIAGFTTTPYESDGARIVWGQEFHSSYWGHIGILAPDDHLLEPGFSAYALSGLASAYPTNGAIADLAHAQHALVGYVHPFDERVDPDAPAPLTNELPADVVHGKVDYYEVVGFSDHKASAEVWYRLLDLGFRLATGSGTDAMANYASLRGPVGMNRVFLNAAPSTTVAQQLQALKAGRTFATNSALLGFEVARVDGNNAAITAAGKVSALPDATASRPGDALDLAPGQQIAYRASLRSIVPMDHFEIVRNGRVVATLKLDKARTSADIEGTLTPDASGWLVLRAWNNHADPRVQDIYPYATTSPVYLNVGGIAPHSPDDARFFVRWLDRTLESAGARTDYNSEREKADTLYYLKSARAKFEAMQ